MVIKIFCKKKNIVIGNIGPAESLYRGSTFKPDRIILGFFNGSVIHV